jgi:hypothetical protein
MYWLCVGFVGLSHYSTEDELKKMFLQFGQIDEGTSNYLSGPVLFFFQNWFSN